jgi:hypothetical protein
MNRDTQRTKAEEFRAMHDRSRILVLPNAWDAMSARVIEDAGARAIATTNAGVAFSAGYPDGEAIPRDEMISAIARIARVVTIPVSSDIESGLRGTLARSPKPFAAPSTPAQSASTSKTKSMTAPRASTIWTSPSNACAPRAKRQTSPASRS